MTLSRKSLKKSETQVKNKTNNFIEAAELLKSKQAGRPKTDKELTKSISLSLTKSEQVLLDGQARRFNLLSYQQDNTSEVNLGRSDIVRLMSNYCSSLNDKQYFEFIGKIRDVDCY